MQNISEPQLSLLRAWLTIGQLSAKNTQDWCLLFDTHKLSPAAFIGLSDSDWQALGVVENIIARRSLANTAAERTLEFLSKQQDVFALSYQCPAYPERLKQVPHPPAVIFVKGLLENIELPQIAIVGARQASINGKRVTEQFARELAEHRFVITSGLARGIDSYAHWGALQSEGGKTMAVLGCGIDICYPKYNQPLMDTVLARAGTVISEFLPGVAPKPYHFPRRNRIVAGLSEGVLLVEAKIRSGSLITCNLAADMGKDVFAIPGNINQPLSEGGNWLIQQGAKLTTSVQDIIEEYSALSIQKRCTDTEKKHLASDPILDSVDYDVTQLSDISRRSKLSSQEVLTALLEYQLRGLVAAVPGGYVKLRGK